MGRTEGSDRGSWLKKLYVQVLLGILAGVLVGCFLPNVGAALSPIADGFIKLIKMMLAPIVFGTVVVGIARMHSIREVGRIGLKAIVYFEVLSTAALAIGLVLMNVFKPGMGLNIDPASLDTESVAGYAAAKSQSLTQFALNIIPTTLTDAFATGAILQVILIALLFGAALSVMGDRGKPLVDLIDTFLQTLFQIVGFIMRLAPLAAGAGIAFTIGKYGTDVLLSLAGLVVVMYAAAFLFVTLVLGGVVRLSGMRLLPILRYLREEILIVFGTCSTEAVMPAMLAKMEALGAEKSVVGLVLPAGYTFNADGTCLYLTGAAVFIAQATNTPFPLTHQLGLLAILLLTSKGSAGVAGAGFVTLAATLSALHTLPVAGIVLLLGVDRILNIPRAVVNLIGNSVATLVVARWEGMLDREKANKVLAKSPAT